MRRERIERTGAMMGWDERKLRLYPPPPLPLLLPRPLAIVVVVVVAVSIRSVGDDG